MKGPTVDVNSFSEALLSKRKQELGATLREVATETGVNASSLSRIESKNMPDLSTYIKLCRWLGVPMEQFIIG